MTHGRRSSKLINGVAVLVLLAGASTAAGDDAKVFPGTMCRQIGATSSVRYDSQGRVQNGSFTSPVTVICPIVRDHTTERWKSIAVVVGDRSYTSNVTCQAHSSSPAGVTVAFPPRNPIPAGYFDWDSSRSYTLTFDPPYFERDNGAYFITCSIPPVYGLEGLYKYSEIISYRINEP